MCSAGQNTVTRGPADLLDPNGRQVVGHLAHFILELLVRDRGIVGRVIPLPADRQS